MKECMFIITAVRHIYNTSIGFLDESDWQIASLMNKQHESVHIQMDLKFIISAENPQYENNYNLNQFW